MGRISPHFAVAIPETRLNADTLKAKGSGTNDSAYTEAGPEPGHPEPDDPSTGWRPYIRGAQSVALTARTIQGGYAGRDGASVVMRLGSETTQADWMGWDDPNVVCDWTTPADGWGAAAAWTDVTATVLPDSQKIIVVARASGDAQTWEFDPRTETWTSLYDWTTAPGLDGPICLVYDEEASRLLLFSGNGDGYSRDLIAFQSTDGGATWSLYARGQYNSSVTATYCRIAIAPGADWLAIIDDKQFASSDRGQHWQVIASSLTGTDHYPLYTGQGYLVLYVNAGGDLCQRRLGSARASFEDATEEILLDASVIGYSLGNVAAVRDYDGCLYFVSRGAVSTADQDIGAVQRSVDGGASWDGYSSYMRLDYVTWRALVSAASSLWGLAFNVGHADVDGTFALFRLGGWTNVEAGASSIDGLAGSRLARSSPGDDTADFFPTDLPQNQGWTRLGAAGTQSLNGSQIGYELSATQLQDERYQETGAAMSVGNTMAGQCCIQVSAGTAPLGPSGVTYDSGLQIVLRVGDGTAWTRAALEIGSDGIQVWDGTTRRSALAEDMTDWMHLRWFVRLGSSTGGITLWWRRDGTRKWTRVANDDALARTVAVLASSVIWGHGAAAIAGTSVLRVRYLSSSVPGTWYHQLDSLGSVDDSPSSGVLGLWYGRPVPGRDGRYPVPFATADTEDVGFLSGGGGATYVSETVELPVKYQYGIEQIYPDASPSPREPWRATDTSEVKLVWDQGSNNETWYGASLALLVLSATPRSFALEQDDGAGGWSTLGTLDKGWSSINYTRVGNTITPRTGTATIDRYFGEDELVGGYVVMSTAGTSVARRIARQSPGFWSTSGSVQQMRLVLEGIDGSETANGSGEIVHHSGLYVYHQPSDTPRRRLRVRIASGAITPEGRYEAGILAICRVLAVGTVPAWDWSRRLDLSREVTRRADQRMVVRRLGPPRRVIEYGWPDGSAMQELRTLAELPDYLAGTSAAAIGTDQDAVYSVPALIEHATRSGEVPVVVIPQLSESAGTITDPTAYLYGLIASDSIGVSCFLGSEGVDEVLRLDSLAVEEVR